MRAPTSLLAGLVLVLSAPAFAASQDKQSADPAKPMSERSTTMGDAATTPLSDLNIKKDAVPQLLVTAQQDTYSLAGLRTCPQIAAAVGELDAVLGADLDLPAEARERFTAGRVAQAAVGAFIPFRGVIREISGANESDRKMQAAIMAGLARRGYLKGYGQARGCRYPARAATAADIAAIAAAAPPAKDDKAKDGKSATEASGLAPAAQAKPVKVKRRKGKVRFVEQPVVQKTN